MTDHLPMYISLVFILTSLATLLLFIWSIKNAKTIIVQKKATVILFGLIFWLLIQAILSIKNVYNTETRLFPPKIILLGILPALLAILYLFLTEKGRQFIDSLPLRNLTGVNDF